MIVITACQALPTPWPPQSQPTRQVFPACLALPQTRCPRICGRPPIYSVPPCRKKRQSGLVIARPQLHPPSWVYRNHTQGSRPTLRQPHLTTGKPKPRFNTRWKDRLRLRPRLPNRLLLHKLCPALPLPQRPLQPCNARLKPPFNARWKDRLRLRPRSPTQLLLPRPYPALP